MKTVIPAVLFAALSLLAIPAQADSQQADTVHVAGSASWAFSYVGNAYDYTGNPETGPITQTFNVSFNYNTVSEMISDVAVSSWGPMGLFSSDYTPPTGGNSPIFGFSDTLGDGIQIADFYGIPAIPFPEIGSQLQIVVDYCEICNTRGSYIGEGGTVVVTPEPSTSLMLALGLLALCFISSRSRSVRFHISA
jgi:hypothetical protein